VAGKTRFTFVTSYWFKLNSAGMAHKKRPADPGVF
jgi:hypothetical protein